MLITTNEPFFQLAYWVALALVALVAILVSGSPIFSYPALTCVFIAQYGVYAAYTFGIGDPITLFCFYFIAIYCATLRLFSSSRWLRPTGRTVTQPITEHRWFHLCRTFLIGYWALRLVFYPFETGVLDLEARLSAQQQNPLLFFLGLAYVPAAAACAYAWFSGRRKFRALDLLATGLMLVGLYGSGSKAVFLPMVIIAIGTVALLGRRSRRRAPVMVPVFAIAAVVGYLRLKAFFPGYSGGQIMSVIAYRLFSNTDSLTYLDKIGAEPSDYPFAGLPSLAPFVASRLGFYDYPAGVWLHGSLTGDWSGYGPNSGLVMDYYANLSWAGLIAAVFLALFVAVCLRVGGIVGASFLSIAYLAVVDLSLFQVAFGVWLFAALGLALAGGWIRSSGSDDAVAEPHEVDASR